MNKSRIIAFIPARGGSKSIPLKNIKLFCGMPLLYWVTKAANDSEKIDAIYVSTDDDRIKSVVQNFSFDKVTVVPRSNETACDDAPTEAAMIEFATAVDFDHIVLIQATSPLLKTEDLDNGIEKFFKTGADSLLSVVKQKRFIWKEEGAFAKAVNYDTLKRPRRQDWDGYFVENGAFYITSKTRLDQTQCRVSGNIVLFEMAPDTYFEMDEPADWTVAESLLRRFKENSNEKNLIEKLKKIKLFVMDVDGVLTDAGMYYSESGDELKKFNTRDGKGLELIRKLGIKTALITSESTDLVERRAKKLKIDFVIQAAHDKTIALKELIAANGLSYENVAYIGDDLNDSEALKEVGFSATPADGADRNKGIAVYLCKAKGGEGCVREICDMLSESLSR